MEFTFEDNAEVPEAEFETKVPADFRSFYAKGNDGIYRVADGIAAGASKVIDGLTKNLKSAKATNQSVGLESKQRREAIEAWKALGETPEAVQATLAELQDKINKNSKINPEEIKASIQAGFTAQLDAEKVKTGKMFATLDSNLRQKDALSALAEHKGNSKLLMPIIMGRTKLVEDETTGAYYTVVLNDKGETRHGSDGSPLSISKFVAELREDKDLAGAFEGTKQTGSGAQPARPGSQQQQQQRTPQQQQEREQRGVSKISAGLNGTR